MDGFSWAHERHVVTIFSAPKYVLRFRSLRQLTCRAATAIAAAIKRPSWSSTKS
jgi:hypothetical protein